MKEIYIIDAKRTPFGKFRGFFSDQNPIDMASQLLSKMLSKNKLPKKQIEAVYIGNVCSTGLGQNPARQVALHCGLSQETISTTINDVCGSSLKAMRLAQAQMQIGDFDMVAVGGVENMTQAPFFVESQFKDQSQDHLQWTLMHDCLNDAFSHQAMGITAEMVAQAHKISRDAMDQYAYESHQKAIKAIKSDWFAQEIIPFKKENEILVNDENVRFDTSLEKLAQLRSVFMENGTVTAGNSSPLSDGASFLILATGDKVKELKLKPIAKLGQFIEIGCDPNYMGYGPYYAIRKLLNKTNTTIDDYDVIEINEAFAAQIVAVARDLKIPNNKLNIAGGAISLGHPLGATGTRLVATAINNLHQVSGHNALVSLCIGGGQAIACNIECVTK